MTIRHQLNRKLPRNQGLACTRWATSHIDTRRHISTRDTRCAYMYMPSSRIRYSPNRGWYLYWISMPAGSSRFQLAIPRTLDTILPLYHQTHNSLSTVKTVISRRRICNKLCVRQLPQRVALNRRLNPKLIKEVYINLYVYVTAKCDTEYFGYFIYVILHITCAFCKRLRV